MYGEFANYYDLLMEDIDLELWFKHIDKWLKNIKKTKALELGAGTGAFTEKLSQDFALVKAVDLSPEMLAIGEARLRNRKNIHLFNLNIVDFDFQEKFDLILAACDVYNYLLSQEELEASFTRVYNHLDEEGLFLFDLSSKSKLKDYMGDNIFYEDREDLFYLWETDYKLDEDIIDYYLTFFVKEGDFYRKFYEDQSLKAWDREEIIELLVKVGFKYKVLEVDGFEGREFYLASKASKILDF